MPNTHTESLFQQLEATDPGAAKAIVVRLQLDDLQAGASQ